MTHPARGFTLIELLVTIAIVAVAMAVGIPSFVTFQRNGELTSAANSLTAAINAARGEAMKRNLNARVVPSTANGWGGGVLVYVDINRNKTYDLNTDVLVMQQPAVPSYLKVTGFGSTATATAPYLLFNGSGFATTDDAAPAPASSGLEVLRRDVTGGDVYKQTRNVMIARTGRVRVCTPTGSSDVNCNTTDLD